jgi:hypothetical protein
MSAPIIILVLVFVMSCCLSVITFGGGAAYLTIFSNKSNYYIYEGIDNQGFDITEDQKETDGKNKDKVQGLIEDCNKDDDCTHFTLTKTRYYPKEGKKANIRELKGALLFVKKSNKDLIEKIKDLGYKYEK